MDSPVRKTGFKGTAENAKTQLCTRWLNGDCRFGDRCNFAHGEAELRQAPTRGRGRGTGTRTATGRAGSAVVALGRSEQPLVSEHIGVPMYQPHMSMRDASSPSYAAHAQHASPDSHASSYINSPLPENIWAACGFPLVGANGWVLYRVQDTGEPYFHNAERNLTQWDQPADFIEH